LLLLVEDDKATANFMRITLTLAGHSVEACPSRESALEVLNDLQPSVVVMDYLMAGLDAETFLARARESGYVGKVLLCTGLDQAVALGVDAIVRKPFQPDDLIAAIESLLASQEDGAA
jgi:DNA-binding response OmpR family regulator